MRKLDLELKIPDGSVPWAIRQCNIIIAYSLADSEENAKEAAFALAKQIIKHSKHELVSNVRICNEFEGLDADPIFNHLGHITYCRGRGEHKESGYIGPDILWGLRD